MIDLAYLGHVLGMVQQQRPTVGTVILDDWRQRRVQLGAAFNEVESILTILRTWIGKSLVESPVVILNDHCPVCAFRDLCLQQAKKNDSLSLLDRMTPAILKKYHQKGIFTLTQLSYLFRPRRSRRQGKRPVRHSLELQALAIRTGKTYIEHLPTLLRSSVELFVDIEGIPDHDSYYLIGLLVCENGAQDYHAYWANNADDEAEIWNAFSAQVENFPDAHLYHYGNYERRAFKTLAKRHGQGHDLLSRLVNVSTSIYGRIYFPVLSNRLKVLAGFLGATWSAPEASGLQSLVWRHRWETTKAECHRESLLTYNREDCEALCVLVEALSKIKETAHAEPTIDFAHRAKQNTTETGKEVHFQLERILHSAEQDSARRAFRIRSRNADGADQPKKRGAPQGHQAFHRVAPPKAGRIVRLAPRRKCPKHHLKLTLTAQPLAERTVIDLNFTRSGCRKTITKYVGKKGYCPRCNYHYLPPSFHQKYKSLFGHRFQAWAIYQRIILRLPYRIITQVMEHLFGVGLSAATAVKFFQSMADFYADTEANNLQAILQSGFIHVDETRLNIQGIDQYVWVFTDGTHVLFRMTETREADVVAQMLAGYDGVLVSDFYPGYDSIPCRQQKCLVHLIRDLNDDLWKAPFDRELEAFVLAVRNLLVPILEAVDKFGLKARRLRKFQKNVQEFYDANVLDRQCNSGLVGTYQKRFQRYREGLFEFLTQDGIPWNNNMAERAIRQLAVQRKISGTFFKRVALQYLTLLAIAQTCRFQDKSFLKFLLSKATNIDEFRRTRPIKHSNPVSPKVQGRPDADEDKNP